ncbi:MAG TPA: TIGR04283 family arsenosugar biosynthesis glycosyltransferase [Casimicrobiaceae bacterium]|jgi:rSAM/selenodomain-associated transferase 2|nr:TIGR04283 family arsenosugar biosynthesis glycosyltransferase [Casimicrobiaceae bacterium]
MITLSVIVPTLNEAQGIGAYLWALQPLRRRGNEVIVVDGGSSDDTPGLAAPLADRVISARRGRASQMNTGARYAHGNVLLFLHADTRLPECAESLLANELADERWMWGRFDVAIESAHPLLPVVAWFMSRRSRLTGIVTGDQAMFVRRQAFATVGGFPDLPLMEDIALSRRLKCLGRPLCLNERAITSGRRWEQRGVLRTIVLMWRLRAGYWLGADPSRLAQAYAATSAER